MANYDSNYEIAQEISARIGTAPIPFDSVYSIALEIYHQLGGEESQFDSVYSILLEILPLIEGGSGKAIEEVGELPEASENKDKLFRLDNGEKDVYVAKLLSSETITTNKLPDEQQIDKAYIYTGGDNPHYKGTYTITCSDGVLNWYLWDIDGFKLTTSENAVNSTSTTPCAMVDSESEYWSDVTSTGATTTMTMQELEEDDTIEANGVVIPAIYNASESAQIGNAYLVDEANVDLGIYEGTQVTFIDTNGSGEEVTGYKWTINGKNEEYIATSKPASEFYFYYDEDNSTYYKDVIVWDVYWNVDDEVWESERVNISTSTESNLYIPQLNAPDSEQVDNASLSEDYFGVTYVYSGEETIIEVNEETIDVYVWESSAIPNSPVYSTKPAYQVYNTDKDSADVHFYVQDGDVINEITFAEGTLLSISTVKYQRTETTEEWDWKNIIQPAIIDVEELPDEVTDANKGNIYRPEGDNNYIAALGNEGLEWQSIATNNYVDYTVGYNVPVIQGTANLNYNQDYTLSGISNVVLSINEPYGEWTDAGIANVTVSFTLNVSGMEIGSVYATGTMAKYSMNIGPISGTNYRFTFPFVKLGAQPTQGTLFIDYVDSDDTWTVKLQEN